MSSRTQPYLIGGLSGLALGLLALLVLTVGPWRSDDPIVEPPRDEVADQDPTNDLIQSRSNALVRAIRTVSPTVVSIDVYRSHRPRPIDGFQDALERFFSLRPRRPRAGGREQVGFGSGIVVSHDGQILTSNHVVADGEEIVITTSRGETVVADLVGASALYDLALLQIRGEVSGLDVAELGDSDSLQIGEWAIAIGSPYGNYLADSSPTATVGVISAINRDIKPSNARQQVYYDMIQTDAAINPGNSGGPLVDSNGKVVGINTFVFSRSGESVGIGFAVPINRGRWILEEIRTHGGIRATYAGIYGKYITPDLRESGVPTNWPDGFLVSQVDADSPGSRAGIRTDDILVRIDGEAADSATVTRRMYESQVGTTLHLTVWRDGEVLEMNLVLESQPDAR